MDRKIMMYVKTDENGIVTQKQVKQEDGFIQAPDHVVPGFAYNGAEFHAPPSPHHVWGGSQWVKDQKAEDQARIDEIHKRLEQIDDEHGDRAWRNAVISGEITAHEVQVGKKQKAENEAQALRDELSTLNN